jgi:hypothetical protein
LSKLLLDILFWMVVYTSDAMEEYLNHAENLLVLTVSRLVCMYDLRLLSHGRMIFYPNFAFFEAGRSLWAAGVDIHWLFCCDYLSS